VAIPQILVEQR